MLLQFYCNSKVILQTEPARRIATLLAVQYHIRRYDGTIATVLHSAASVRLLEGALLVVVPLTAHGLTTRNYVGPLTATIGDSSRQSEHSNVVFV